MGHVVVVGAGIVGLSVSRAALLNGHAVTLFEEGTIANAMQFCEPVATNAFQELTQLRPWRFDR